MPIDTEKGNVGVTGPKNNNVVMDDTRINSTQMSKTSATARSAGLLAREQKQV
jgi:hypothetical protein